MIVNTVSFFPQAVKKRARIKAIDSAIKCLISISIAYETISYNAQFLVKREECSRTDAKIPKAHVEINIAIETTR